MRGQPNRGQRILRKPGERIRMSDQVEIDGCFIPSFRTAVALQDKTNKNILMRTWGGIGDQICAEPTLRWAVKNLTDCKISLASPYPELFSHLTFEKIFKLPHEVPPYDDYYLFDTVVPATFLVWEFFAHATTNCVDFPSLCAFRMQLPMAEKQIILPSQAPNNSKELANRLVVHPGRHWPSKTFPKDWWDRVIKTLVQDGYEPVIIGSNSQDKIMKAEYIRGTVNVDTTGCLDLRDKTSLLETIWILQRAHKLFTNDSSPLHMAASVMPGDWDRFTGRAYIEFVATCKYPEYITHWRHGAFGWRERNWSLGGMWESMPKIANSDKEFFVDTIDEATLRSWLPDPVAFAKGY